MKERLDVVLVRDGFSESREKAKRVIMAGLVYVDGLRTDKAGTLVKEGVVIEVRGAACPYVSRGGSKLKKAVDTFELDLEGKICADFGASTGGFTDCMLQQGAAKVYSLDVGYGQLDWKLRNDPRVVNMERVNIRYLSPEAIQDRIDFISIDVSFISLAHILPVAAAVIKPGGQLVCLIKPQFEAGRAQVGKNGIVKDPAVHRAVIHKVVEICRQTGFQEEGLTFSPFTGAKGNIEYLLYARAGSQYRKEDEVESGQDVSQSGAPTVGRGKSEDLPVDQVVEEAHNRLLHAGE